MKIIALIVGILLVGCASRIHSHRCGNESACAYAICTGTGCDLFAQNKNIYPVTVAFDMETEGLYHKSYADEVFVVEPKKVMSLGMLRYNGSAKMMTVRLRPKIVTGSYKSVHDSSYLYQLPFCSGKKYLVRQGYRGWFAPNSKWRYSIDFGMQTGDTVCAARGGTVIEVNEAEDVGHPIGRCGARGNYVMILHDDGTMAQYSHLQNDGALVRVGDQVSDGMPIALAGATGSVNRPHLHFMVIRVTRKMGYESIPTRFMTSGGEVPSLIEYEEYVAE